MRQGGTFRINGPYPNCLLTAYLCHLLCLLDWQQLPCSLRMHRQGEREVPFWRLPGQPGAGAAEKVSIGEYYYLGYASGCAGLSPGLLSLNFYFN